MNGIDRIQSSVEKHAASSWYVSVESPTEARRLTSTGFDMSGIDDDEGNQDILGVVVARKSINCHVCLVG